MTFSRILGTRINLRANRRRSHQGDPIVVEARRDRSSPRHEFPNFHRV